MILVKTIFFAIRSLGKSRYHSGLGVTTKWLIGGEITNYLNIMVYNNVNVI